LQKLSLTRCLPVANSLSTDGPRSTLILVASVINVILTFFQTSKLCPKIHGSSIQLTLNLFSFSYFRNDQLRRSDVGATGTTRVIRMVCKVLQMENAHLFNFNFKLINLIHLKPYSRSDFFTW
jgi:hypothetical protein